jgi:hypothetical protein
VTKVEDEPKSKTRRNPGPAAGAKGGVLATTLSLFAAGLRRPRDRSPPGHFRPGARRLEPKLTVKWLISVAPNIPNLFEGVRKAGLPEDAPPEPAHLSLVVLPFTNLSGDPTQD